jgi:hypothetical protein
MAFREINNSNEHMAILMVLIYLLHPIYFNEATNIRIHFNAKAGNCCIKTI